MIKRDTQSARVATPKIYENTQNFKILAHLTQQRAGQSNGLTFVYVVYISLVKYAAHVPGCTFVITSVIAFVAHEPSKGKENAETLVKTSHATVAANLRGNGAW